MISVGLIGYGYWGPNLARNFNQNPNFKLTSICDFSPDRLEQAAQIYPQTRMRNNVKDLFNSNHTDAIAIATPVSTHYKLAKTALQSGKHVWIEKPMTDNVEHAEELIELAQKMNKTLIVDHTFIYTGAVRKIKEMIDADHLGDLIYYDSTRVNLGLFQQDVDVVWDLAAHDISIMDHLMGQKMLAVSATGSDFYNNGMVPKSLLTVFMENNIVGHINVSWVSPVKIRQTLIGGTTRMVLYNDNDPSEKVKIYDKGVELSHTKEELYHLKVQYRIGDMHAPKLDDTEALKLETEHFAECINTGNTPLSDGKAGLEVVKVLVASKTSLKQKGVPVYFD